MTRRDELEAAARVADLDILKRTLFPTDATAALVASVDLTSAPGKAIGPKDVRSAVTFVPAAGAVLDGKCRMTLIADGSHIPDFSAFTALAGSSSWSNTAGHTHQAEFWYDGSRAWYSLATGASPAIGLTLHSLSVDGVTLTASANVALNTGYTPAGAAFTVTVNGAAVAVNAVVVASGGITLTLASAVVGGQTVTLSVDRDATNYLRANADNSKLAVPVSGAAVTNNSDSTGGVAAYSFAVQTASFRDPSETGIADFCDGTTAGSWQSGRMTGAAGATISLASGVPGWLGFKHRDADIGGGVCVYSSSAVAPANTSNASLWVGVKSSNKHLIWTSAAVSAGAEQDTGITVADGTWVRLRRAADNNYHVEYSVDNGANWTVAQANAINSATTHYPYVLTYGATSRGTYRPRLAGFA